MAIWKFCQITSCLHLLLGEIMDIPLKYPQDKIYFKTWEFGIKIYLIHHKIEDAHITTFTHELK